MYAMAPGSSPATSQPVVMVQGRPMVAVSRPLGQPVIQGQPMMAVSQTPGQPVVQGQPMMVVASQTSGQPMVAVKQTSGQPVVHAQPTMVVNQQSAGQPVVSMSQSSQVGATEVTGTCTISLLVFSDFLNCTRWCAWNSGGCSKLE